MGARGEPESTRCWPTLQSDGPVSVRMSHHAERGRELTADEVTDRRVEDLAAGPVVATVEADGQEVRRQVVERQRAAHQVLLEVGVRVDEAVRVAEVLAARRDAE